MLFNVNGTTRVLALDVISQDDCELALQNACLDYVWMSPALFALMVVASGPF